jgi:hypothetical protein
MAESEALTLRRFGFEIVTIILGVLIALAFNGLTDWRNDRRLVKEAVENLQAEMRDNQTELKKTLARLPAHRQEADHTLRLVARVIQLKQSEGHASVDEKITLGLNSADLKDSSWSTAEQTGAFGRMKYDQVKRYAGVYSGQRKFMQLQDRLTAQFILVLPLGSDKVADMSVADLERWRQNLTGLQQHSYMVEQLGQQLDHAYGEALRSSPPR